MFCYMYSATDKNSQTQKPQQAFQSSSRHARSAFNKHFQLERTRHKNAFPARWKIRRRSGARELFKYPSSLGKFPYGRERIILPVRGQARLARPGSRSNNQLSGRITARGHDEGSWRSFSRSRPESYLRSA